TILSGGSALPFQLGSLIKNLLQGGPTTGPATLQRFFMAHVFLLPGLLIFLMYVHIRLLRKDGPAPPLDSRLAERHSTGGTPADETHPIVPDHFWPYPVIAGFILVTLGLLAALLQRNLQLDVPADPRSGAAPHPDWFFLFLFQFLKLGPEFLMSLVIPSLALLALLLWPLIDSALGPRLARRLGWSSWPVPGRNVVTGTLLVAVGGVLAFLTGWSLAGPDLCLPWPVNGPVGGG